MILQYELLGTSDLSVSNVCLGTMTFGEQNDETSAHAQLDLAVEMGVNFIDTAEMYPVPAKAETQSATESIIGSWLAKGNRDKVVLATKVAAHSGMTWIRDGARLDTANIREAVEGSLRRLQTDTIDLYQIHWPDRYVPKFGGLHFEPNEYYQQAPILETLQVIHALIQEGKIRYFGLSNETPWGTCHYLQLAERYSLPRPVSIQNAYNLLNRTYDTGMAEVTYHEKIPLLPYSVLAFGYLTGKYRDGALPEGSRVALFPDYPQRYKHKVNKDDAIDAYAAIAAEEGISLTTLALRFAASRFFVGSTIIGATSVHQIRENVEAFAEPLSDACLQAIDEVHFRYPNPCP